MTHEEFTDFVEQIERFDGALFNQAARHLEAGEDAAAGLLLTLKARLVLIHRMWDATVRRGEPIPAADPSMLPPTPAPAVVKCRHEFEAVPAAGGAPVCMKCGIQKRANGRPRNPPAAQAADVGHADARKVHETYGGAK